MDYITWDCLIRFTSKWYFSTFLDVPNKSFFVCVANAVNIIPLLVKYFMYLLKGIDVGCVILVGGPLFLSPWTRIPTPCFFPPYLSDTVDSWSHGLFLSLPWVFPEFLLLLVLGRLGWVGVWTVNLRISF